MLRLRAGDTIENPLSGHRITLLVAPAATGGRSFQLEARIPPHSGREGIPRHLHPTASERFEIRGGRARFEYGTVAGELGPGDAVTMPANVPHLHPWSVSDEELVYVQTAVADPPALDLLENALQGLDTLFFLARHGKTNREGMASPLQMAVIGRAMMPGTYLANLPVAVQRLALPPLAALGRAAGYRLRYL